MLQVKATKLVKTLMNLANGDMQKVYIEFSYVILKPFLNPLNYKKYLKNRTIYSEFILKKTSVKGKTRNFGYFMLFNPISYSV